MTHPIGGSTRTSSSGAWDRLAVVVGTTAVIATLGLFLMTAGDALGQAAVWENAHWTVSSLAAAVLAYLGYRRAAPDERTARAAIAAGLTIYLAGAVAWDLQVAAETLTVPAPSDVLFIGSTVPIGLAFVHRLHGRLTRTERIAFFLDVAMLVATISLVLWFAYGETALVLGDPMAGVILLLYPIAFLTAAGTGAIAALRARIGASWTGINVLLLGLSATGLAWVEWVNQAVVAIPPVGSPISYGFSLAALATGIGAYRLRLRAEGGPVLARVASGTEILFPMIAVVVAMVAMNLVEEVRDEAMHVSVHAGGFLIVALAIARQSILMVERQLLAARDRRLRDKERTARIAAEEALAAQRASEARYRDVVDVFGRLGEQLSFAADEPTLIRGGVAALRKLVRSDAGDLLLANASQDRLMVGSAWGPGAPSPEELVDGLRPTSCLGIRRGSVYAISDAGDDLMLACPAHPIQRGSLLCVPMLALGQTIGVVHLEASEPNAFGVDDERQAQRVAEQVALAIANARLVRTMESMALTDPLTRLHNARFFDPFLDRELASAERAGDQLGVVMIDLDRFKAFNDEYGHPAGDEALRAFARAALTVLRDSDTLARYGGEEFVVAVRGAGLDEARDVAERLRAAVEGASIEVSPGRYATVTASLGVASTTLYGFDRLALLKAADRALYRAKRAGRNRVEAAGAPRANRRERASRTNLSEVVSEQG